MTSRSFSPEELQQLENLRALGDEDIDLSDIPEITEAQWRDPRRHRPNRSGRAMNLTVDPRVAHWFEGHAGGRSAEEEINRVLLQYVSEQQRRAG